MPSGRLPLLADIAAAWSVASGAVQNLLASSEWPEAPLPSGQSSSKDTQSQVAAGDSSLVSDMDYTLLTHGSSSDASLSNLSALSKGPTSSRNSPGSPAHAHAGDLDSAGAQLEAAVEDWVKHCTPAQVLALAGAGCSGPCSPDGTCAPDYVSVLLADVCPSSVASGGLSAFGRDLAPEPAFVASAAYGYYSWPPRDDAAFPTPSDLHVYGLLRAACPPTSRASSATGVIR